MIESQQLRSAKIVGQQGNPPIVRSFWCDRPLGLYQLLSLRSFVDRGIRVELFSYDRDLAVPRWLTVRNANEIWPTDHVLRYQSGFGKGSPALHANLFRYAMLYVLGGWWVDLDIVLLRSELPDADIFFARLADPEVLINSALKFPQGHPLLAEARNRSAALGEACYWGQTGSDLLKELVLKYDLMAYGQPIETTYPIPWFEIKKIFDPSQLSHVQQQCQRASFLHLFNELWRQTGISSEQGPPEGSFLDQLCTSHNMSAYFSERMAYSDVEACLAKPLAAISSAAADREP